MPEQPNTLYYGDNLTILRQYIKDGSVDLVYLDPPFNSQRTYNVLFRHESGKESEAQIAAFDDTWHWDRSAEDTYRALVTEGDERVGRMIAALREFIGTNQMLAYLVMMAARLVELHRVLKPTGSLYLHCDPTASHYLKIILDTIFGVQNFRNEIVWQRSSAHNDGKQGAKQAGRIHDIILFYTKSDEWIWNTVYTDYDKDYVDSHYRHVDDNGRRYRIGDLTAAKPGGDVTYLWRIKRDFPNGEWQADLDNEYLQPKENVEYKGIPPYKNRYWAYSKTNMRLLAEQGRLYYAKSGTPSYKRYLDDMPGVSLQDLWLDIPPLTGQAAERLGYPTQKPLALLERIIAASSNPGDVVLDPFCGCGTAVVAAEKLERRWIGIDITHLAIALMRYRLEDTFPDAKYRVIGEPESAEAARYLAEEDRFQFQWWALSLIKARPLGGEAGSRKGKKGADRGIDGVIAFIDDASLRAKRALVQVKSGKVSSRDIRDLRGTIEREKAEIGIFITLEEPTREMTTEAVSAGKYDSPAWGPKFDRVRIVTIRELLAGGRQGLVPSNVTFQQAARMKEEGPGQLGMTFDDRP